MCKFSEDFILLLLTAHDGVFALDDPERDGVAGGEGGGVRLAVSPGEVPQQVGVLPHEPQQPHHLPLPPPPLVAGLVLHQVGDNMQRLDPVIILFNISSKSCQLSILDSLNDDPFDPSSMTQYGILQR